MIDNTNMHNIEPYRLIDEVSSTEYYIGISVNGSNPASSYWRIKRIFKVSTVWKEGYPNGNQDFSFVWDDRFTYTYK